MAELEGRKLATARVTQRSVIRLRDELIDGLKKIPSPDTQNEVNLIKGLEEILMKLNSCIYSGYREG